MSEYDYAMTLQTKVLAKYGAEYGITPDVLDRIGKGTASEPELVAYTRHADGLVDRFKADMRQTEPENYSDADIEIIVAMAATNHATFQARDEPFSKVMPARVVGFNLAGGPPTIGGFAAMDRYSEHLSPQQIVSQFGLDYEQKNKSTGEMETPYLVNDGGKKVPQPFVYALKSPVSDAIRDSARIPFDPRILQRIEALANDPAKAGDDIQKMAKMVSRPEVCMVAARAGGDQAEAVQAYKARGFSAQEGTNDAPYTGNSMPQFGNRLENRASYADLVQETSLTRKVEAAAGTAIYLKVPRPGSQDPSAPQGSVEMKVAEWDGRQWQMLATKAQLDAAHEQALASVSLSDTAKAELRSRMVTHESLVASRDAGESKRKLDGALDTPLGEEVKKKIASKETDAKRELLTKLTGDALVAAAAAKLKKKKKKKKNEEEEKRKAKKRREEAEEAEQEREENEEQQEQEQAQQAQEQSGQPSQAA